MKLKTLKRRLTFTLLRKFVLMKRFRLKTAHKKALITGSSFVLILFYNNCGPGFKATSEIAALNTPSGDMGTTTTTSSSTTTMAPTTTTTTTSTTVTLPPGMTSTTTTSTTLKPTTTTTSSTTTTTLKATTTTTSTTLPAVTTTTTLPPATGSSSVAPIAFPPNGGTSDSHIVVRGTLVAGVSQVSVNGTSATITGSTWRLDVPLNVGSNTLSVSVVMNGATKTGVSSSVIQRYASDAVATRGSGSWPGRALGLAYDNIHHRVILPDDVVDGIFAVNVSDGNRVKLADSEDSPQLGGGVDITFPTSTTSDGNQAYIVDDNLFIRIDLANGNRYLVNTGKGNYSGLYLSPDSSSLYVLNVVDSDGNTNFVKFNMATGTFTTIYGGSGYRNAIGLGISFAHSMAYSSIYYSDTIYSIDMTTGAYKAFSSAQGSEPKFSSPTLVVDDADNRGFVLSGKQLAVVDMTTGRRALFGNTGIFSSMSFSYMTMSEYGPVLYDGGSTVIVIDPIEGTRLLLGH